MNNHTWDEGSRFWIAPWMGWEEEFNSWEEAIKAAQKYIEEDFEQLQTKHGYKKAEHLVDVRNG
ncbi:hypothetical protein QT972_00050 [Microcoleus sp. herbarium7]|uniref:hypothetical protein n=1 Tax=Microcoleus sp. herbarium7 TaxID=3055435 RepID=UPI002FD3C3CE